METLITKREDGSWVRKPLLPVEASPRDFQDGVACKDVSFKHHQGQAGSGGHEASIPWARIHLPQTPTLSIDLHSSHKVCPSPLPLILYFHGGGFVFLSAADEAFHFFLQHVAKTAQAIVIAVEYRLAPEHRLPAAYDDCLAAISWLQSQASTLRADETDPWLRAYADFSRCYLMGESAGGNIVHTLSLKLASLKMEPLKFRGHVLIQPFFGGVASTKAEEIIVDSVLTPKISHWFWDQALPNGADRDHSFCNPMSIPISVYEDAQLPKTLIAVALGDPTKERQLQYSDTLKQVGVDARVHLEEGDHGCYLMGEGSVDKATRFIEDVLVTFLHS